MTTTAQQIVAIFGDGQTYKTADGETLDAACRRLGATVEHSERRYDLIRYQFPDGSAIIDACDAWDVRADGCACGWCWDGTGAQCGREEV